MPRKHTDKDNERFLTRLQAMVTLKPTITATEAAEAMGYKQATLSGRLKQLTGQTLREYKSAHLEPAKEIIFNFAKSHPLATYEDACRKAGVTIFEFRRIMRAYKTSWTELTGLTNNERRQAIARIRREVGRDDEDELRPRRKIITVPKELTMQIRPYTHCQDVYNYPI